MVRVEIVRYAEGNLSAGVGDGVTRWGLQIPEENARLIDYEGLVSLQGDARLVKETPDATKRESAEVVRGVESSFLEVEGILRMDRVSKVPSGPSRCLRICWEGLLACGNPVSIEPSVLLKKWVWVYLKRRGDGLCLLGPID